MSDSPKSPKKSPKKKVKMKGGVKATIEAMDKDGDGKIDLAEYMASGGTEEEFKLLDADGSGQIDASELKANEALPDAAPVASPKTPKSPKKKVKMKGGVKATIEAMDKDGDGKIDLAEYMASGGTEEEFKLLDADGSGQIDASELKANESVPDDAYALSDEQMQAEYTRLYKKFTQAMLCGKKYDWSYRKCIDIGYKAEALIRETEEADEALFPKMALGFVMDEIKAEKVQRKQRDWAMKKIVYCMKKNEASGQLIELFSNWVQNKEEANKFEYDRVYAKFTRAMLCGKKYGWSTHKCIVMGAKMEAETAGKGLDEKAEADAALGVVMAEIKAAKIREKQRDWAVKKVIYVVTKGEGKGKVLHCFSNWAENRSSGAK